MRVEVQTQFYPRYMRPVVLLVGLAVYVAFSFGLVRYGYLYAAENAFIQLTVIWVLGLLGLVFLPSTVFSRAFEMDNDSLVLYTTVWCNLGVVAMAVLVPHPLRLAMLVVPVFGIFYAALHLSRAQIGWICLITWLGYGLCNLSLVTYTMVDAQFETLSGAIFVLLLGAGLLLSWESIRLRDDLQERNIALREVMGRLQEMALKDEVTGVHNRRYILEVLARQKALADRGQQKFTLCYCDLDHFKQINDKYGHAVGDAALKRFAELATGVVRSVDYVARIGGEEFVLVLVDADDKAATAVTNRLRERTKAVSIPGTDSEFAMTVSIGVTPYRSAERVDELLNRADRALYHAKRAGRDRVVTSS